MRALRHALAVVLIAMMGFSSAGCAYVLHPERRGMHGGYVDGGDLLLDILWLVPGIIPGVVALSVDFGSGAIYTGGYGGYYGGYYRGGYRHWR